MEVIVDEDDFMEFSDRVVIMRTTQAGGFGGVFAGPQVDHVCRTLGISREDCIDDVQQQVYDGRLKNTAVLKFPATDGGEYTLICVLNPLDEATFLRLGLTRASMEGYRRIVVAMPEVMPKSDREQVCASMRDEFKYRSDDPDNIVEHVTIAVEYSATFAWYLHDTLRDFAPVVA